jgi:hypothetical protein
MRERRSDPVQFIGAPIILEDIAKVGVRMTNLAPNRA